MSVPKEFAWITAQLNETDPLLVFSFVPEAMDALVSELQRVFPRGEAPQIFTMHPFTASSMIGPNTGPEYSRVICRCEYFRMAVSGLGLIGNNLQAPIARPYAIFEGRAT